MTMLKVEFYNEENKELIGTLYSCEEDVRAERILRNYEGTLAGVIDPETEDFIDDISEVALEEFAEYFKDNRCDVIMEISVEEPCR
jgi:hypothetical protein